MCIRDSTKDTWVTSVEIKPSELAVTHHICVSFVPHRRDAVYNTLLWVDKQRDEAGVEVAPAQRKLVIPTADGKGRELPARVGNDGPGDRNSGAVGVGFTCYVPGRALSDFRPFHAALLIPAGSDVNWTIHYTPNGTELTDQPEVGFTVPNSCLLYTSSECARAMLAAILSDPSLEPSSTTKIS